jgi:hypothetical protein
MSNEQLKNIYSTVFDYPVIRDIDKDLLLVAITPPSKGKVNNDRLEFLGDAVLELAISDMLYKQGILEVGKLSTIRQVIVRNVSLICLMNDLNLCDISKPLDKSCADLFEALLGAVYIHLGNYKDFNPISFIIQWLIDVWHFDSIITDIIQHPNDINVCSSIQRSYNEYIAFEPPNVSHIKSSYKQLQKLFQYYQLGPVELKQQYHSKTKTWTVKVVCPLALGCQYYEEKDNKHSYLSHYTDINKQVAIEQASKQAIDVIMNDYDLV